MSWRRSSGASAGTRRWPGRRTARSPPASSRSTASMAQDGRTRADLRQRPADRPVARAEPRSGERRPLLDPAHDPPDRIGMARAGTACCIKEYALAQVELGCETRKKNFPTTPPLGHIYPELAQMTGEERGGHGFRSRHGRLWSTQSYSKRWRRRPDGVLQAAYESAVTGVPEQFACGGKVYTRTRYSDGLLRLLLQATNPKKYGPRPGFTRKRLRRLGARARSSARSARKFARSGRRSRRSWTASCARSRRSTRAR